MELEASTRKRSFNQLLTKGEFDMCVLQETKVVCFQEKGIRDPWVGWDVECTSKADQGRSRGLLVMWKPSTFSLNLSFKGEGFMGMNVSWKGISTYLINIYLSCTTSVPF